MKFLNTRQIKDLSAVSGFLWTFLGIWLLMPWNSFDSSPSFATIRQFANESVSGLILLIIGLLILIPKFNKRIRFAALIASVVAASIGLLTFATANWQGISIPIWGTIFLGTLWAFIKGTEW